VLELGAGTGLLSLVCAKALGAEKVLATDGDEDAVRRLGEGKMRNGIGEELGCEVFWWGEEVVEGEWDLVVAADVVSGVGIPCNMRLGNLPAVQTYEPTSIPALVRTLQDMLKARPTLDVLLSATVRNEDTFKVFTDACGMSFPLCSAS